MKYLIPTDFSDCAQAASDLAISIAKKSEAEVIFLHLMTLPIDYVSSDAGRKESMYPSTKKQEDRIESKLKEWRERAGHQGVRASSHIHYNEDKSFLHKYAKEKEVDLILMGSHGADELRDFFVGTNTQRAVRFSKIPVLVVKNPMKEIKQVALISDFSREALVSEPFIEKFTTMLSAKLHLTFINTPLNFNTSRVVSERLADFNSDFKNSAVTHMYNDFQFESGVTNFCEDYDIDLVIMNTHGRKGIDLAVAGSLTEKVIANLDIPVLCLPLTHEN